MYEYETKALKEYLGGLYYVLKRYKVFLAGGAITSLFTNKEINDLDIYFRSKEELSDFLYEEMRGNWVVAHTAKAFLFKYQNLKVQAIYFRYFDKAEDIFKTFDFTVCMGAFDFEQEKFVLHDDFLKHNSQRILKFNPDTAFPIISALRVDKYKKKGYYISKCEFLRVMLTILDTNIDNYENLKAQMGGMYGENYDTVLEPVGDDDFSIRTIIDKMSQLNVSDKQLGGIGEKEINDWDEFVHKITGVKIKCFEHMGNFYRIIQGEIEFAKNYNGELYKQVDINDVIKLPITRYKYVRKNEDGTYASFYDKSYMWNLGENTTVNRMGLYVVDGSTLECCSYCAECDRALLEIQINHCDDFIDIRKALRSIARLKRAYVVREVPLSEVESIVANHKAKQSLEEW